MDNKLKDALLRSKFAGTYSWMERSARPPQSPRAENSAGGDVMYRVQTITIIILFILVTCAALFDSYVRYYRFYPTIAECEAELPRNQSCHMVAVKKEGE
jgi:hypothetical protein